jgi:hypothetical protein
MTSVSSKQTALLQVHHQRGGSLIGVAAILLRAADDIGVRVPSFIVDINETNAALDHAPRQKAGAGETRLVGIASIHFQGGFAFAFQVHQFRRGRLQPIGHFVRGDAGLDLRITDCPEMFTVELRNQIKGIALQFCINSLWAGHVKIGSP